MAEFCNICSTDLTTFEVEPIIDKLSPGYFIALSKEH